MALTVRELIAELEKFDGGAEAVVVDNNTDGYEVMGVENGEDGEVWITLGEKV